MGAVNPPIKTFATGVALYSHHGGRPRLFGPCKVLTKARGNCKSVDAIEQAHGEEERETVSLCKAGSNFQLIEVDPTAGSKSARELSFSLTFHLDSGDDFLCDWLENAVEFVETVVSVETDTEAAVPEELAVDQKLLEACKGGKV